MRPTLIFRHKKNCLALTPGSFWVSIPNSVELNLESDLQGELDLTPGGGGSCDSSRSEVASWTRKQPRLWIPKIGPVEEVEELGSKLQVSLFRKAGILDQGEIKR